MRGNPVKRGIAAPSRRIGVGQLQPKPIAAIILAVAVVVTSCTPSGPDEQITPTAAVATTTAAGCADVVEATIDPSGDTYRLSATILSGDTGWEKYADAWEVRAPDGTALGTRVLAHPHVDEQPFTRFLDGVAIPAGTEVVELAARDSVVGFCGETVRIAVPER
jgi:hypothetical protein